MIGLAGRGDAIGIKEMGPMNKSMFLMFLLLGVLAGSAQGVITKKNIEDYKKLDSLEIDGLIDKKALQGNKLALTDHNKAILYIQITTANAIENLRYKEVAFAKDNLMWVAYRLQVARNITKNLEGCSDAARKNLLVELDQITNQIKIIKNLETSEAKLRAVKKFAEAVDSESTPATDIFKIKTNMFGVVSDSSTTQDLKTAVKQVRIAWNKVLRTWDVFEGEEASKKTPKLESS